MRSLNTALIAKLCSLTWYVDKRQAIAFASHAFGKQVVGNYDRDEYGPTKDFEGNYLPRPGFVSETVYEIPIYGPLYNGADDYSKMLGMVDHQMIHQAIDFALDNGVETILLDVDSPGGTVNGTPELATKLKNISEFVQIVSWSSGLVASAAEYITAGSTMAFTSPSSTRGSIGTLLEIADFSAMWEECGIKYEQITSGPYKGAGNPNVGLTDDQRASLQSHVNALADEFKDWMIQNRQLDLPSMDGQIFTAKEAVQIGLVDGIMENKQDLINQIR